MNIVIVFITFLIMEGVTWLTHKFVMHGNLWVLHYDHHNKDRTKILEKNDWFFLFFAIISITLFYIGHNYVEYSFCFFIATGILCYGVAYFIVHEIIIHQRISILRNLNFFYFRALIRAHRNHHKHLNKEDGECFGMLWVPIKYFKEAYHNN